MRYISTKTYGHEVGLSCAFRQWRAASHCRGLHGYALAVRVEFESAELDQNNWVVDFGAMAGFEQLLAATFDHKTLVAEDDPELAWFEQAHARGIIDMVRVAHVSCERFAELVFDAAEAWLRDNGHAPRVKVRSVEVREHGANSAIVTAQGRETGVRPARRGV